MPENENKSQNQRTNWMAADFVHIQASNVLLSKSAQVSCY